MLKAAYHIINSNVTGNAGSMLHQNFDFEEFLILDTETLKKIDNLFLRIQKCFFLNTMCF